MCGSKPTDALRTLPERAFRLRARLIAVGLCAVCFAGLIGRLFWLQLCTGGWYTQRALGQQLRDTVVPADRGKIYSADGALLAANSSCWTLRASPREMPEEKLALAAKGLAVILELDEAKLLEKFNDRRSNDCLLRYRVERETADAVRDFCAANGITGVRINQDSKRWYPQGEFLASVLGFTNVDNAGVSGLELEYNDTLTGQNGVVLTAVQIIDSFLVYLLDVLDRHTQTGHAVKYGSNIFLCSSQRHDILRQLFEIFCHCNILQKIFLDGNGQNVPVQFRTENPIQTVQFF